MFRNAMLNLFSHKILARLSLRKFSLCLSLTVPLNQPHNPLVFPKDVLSTFHFFTTEDLPDLGI